MPLTTGYVTITRNGARCKASSRAVVSGTLQCSGPRPTTDKYLFPFFVNQPTFPHSSSHSQVILASLLSRLPSKAQWLLNLPLALTRRSSKFYAGSLLCSVNYYNKYLPCLCDSLNKYLLCLYGYHNKYLPCLCDSLTNIYRVYVTP